MQTDIIRHLGRFERYFRLSLLLWTVVLTVLLFATLTIIQRTTIDLAQKEAIANFNKDQAFRFWASNHGGVYVPVSDDVRPSPYLDHIEERDIVTPSGRELTLVNPAWMLRQLNEQFTELYGVRGHITSEKPIRPENAPDDWERAALRAFAAGDEEVLEEAQIDGQPYLRFMRPMFVQEGCLKCHGFQGYNEGDLRGGVSVSVPLSPYYVRERDLVAVTLASYAGIWLVGLVGLTLGWRRLRRDHQAIKRAEQEVRTLNVDLERRVRERTTELDATNHELEAFAYSVSHDLQAPLRAISGFSLAVLEDYGPKLDEEGRRYLERMDFNAGKMGQLIDDMLRLSRSTRGEMRHEEVDLSALAGEIVASLREEHPERTVEVVIAPGLHTRGDPRLIRALLENLLRNAWKFTGKTEAARIEVGRMQTDHGSAFFVRDNGAGFDMAYVDKLFAPFKRLHATEDFPGSGIGLAIVQRVVHRHGGEAWAEGAVGQGAIFYFTLGGPSPEDRT